MFHRLTRREFLGTAAAAATVLSPLGAGIRSAMGQGVPAVSNKARIVIEPFDYSGVKLRPSRWLTQYNTAREYYLGVPDDDLLKGFREAARLPAPGNHMGGWCANHSGTVFGQWLQAMSRGYRATGDNAMRDKAIRLVEGFAKCVGPEGDPRLVNQFGPPRTGYGAPTGTRGGRRGRGATSSTLASATPTPVPGTLSSRSTYPFEKLFGGLLDIDRYADYKDVRPLLDKMADWSIANLDRRRMAPANRGLGSPTEWYTVGENFYRAYQWMGDEKYREMAKVWQYDSYWNRFENSSDPANIAGLHAYSHVNTFSSCAMAYAVTGDPKFLNIIKNAYDWMQQHECYASGGYGPDEFMMASDGALGTSLEKSVETFESPCGSWAGFKLSKYLLQFTGEARYGDWIEKLLYNGVGAALDMGDKGQTFYYANYNLGSAKKKYYEEAFPCCAGTYFQDVVEYHNLIYFRDADSLYVNLYLPSEVAWKHGEATVKLTQDTSYPESETSNFKLELPREMTFALKFRVPGWSEGAKFKVNGAATDVQSKPGTWATISRAWKSGDTVEITIPLRFSTPAIDAQHTKRVAVMRGPVVLAQEYNTGAPMPAIPVAKQLDKWLAPADAPGTFKVAAQAGVGGVMPGNFKPFYMYGKDEPYRIYFDPDFKPAPVETGKG